MVEFAHPSEVRVDRLKTYLKNKRLKSEKLAQKLKVAPSTVRELLETYELTLERFLKVCQILDLEVSDFLQGGDLSRGHTLTSEQENYFLRNPLPMIFFDQLIHCRDIQMGARFLGIDTIKAKQVVKSLEKYGLIEFNDLNEVVFPLGVDIKFKPNGKLKKTIVAEAREVLSQNCWDISGDAFKFSQLDKPITLGQKAHKRWSDFCNLSLEGEVSDELLERLLGQFGLISLFGIRRYH